MGATVQIGSGPTRVGWTVVAWVMVACRSVRRLTVLAALVDLAEAIRVAVSKVGR